MLVAGKLHPHEEQARGVVVVLRGFFDVAAVFHQEPGHGVHQPQSVGAGQGKDVSRRRPIVALAPVLRKAYGGRRQWRPLRCFTAIAGAVSLQWSAPSRQGKPNAGRHRPERCAQTAWASRRPPGRVFHHAAAPPYGDHDARSGLFGEVHWHPAVRNDMACR